MQRPEPGDCRSTKPCTLAHDPRDDQLYSTQSSNQRVSPRGMTEPNAQSSAQEPTGNSYDSIKLADAARAIIGNVYHFHEAPRVFGHAYESQLHAEAYNQHDFPSNIPSSSAFDEHFPTFSNQGLPSYLRDVEVAPGSRFAKSRIPIHQTGKNPSQAQQVRETKTRDVKTIFARLRQTYNLNDAGPGNSSSEVPPQLHDSQIALRINHWLSASDLPMLYIESSMSILMALNPERAGLEVARICKTSSTPVAAYFSTLDHPHETASISLEQLSLDLIETILDTSHPDTLQRDPIWTYLAEAHGTNTTLNEQTWAEALNAVLQTGPPTLQLIIDLANVPPSIPTRWIIRSIRKSLNDDTQKRRKCLILGSSALVDLRAEFQPHESIIVSTASPTKLPIVAAEKITT